MSSIHCMVMNQMNHQYNGTSNLQNLTSNPVPLLPKPTLRFQLSWGDLIIVPLIMVMLKLPLRSFQLILTLNQFQIQTPLRLNQLIMMKCIISCNYSINNMMKIFWMFTSRCFKLDWWLHLFKNFIQYLLCSFINMEEQMLQSQIACHTCLCFSPTKATVKLANGNTGHAQVNGIILCRLPNCSIIYPVGTVYYCPGHPCNTISSGVLKFYIGF